MSFSNGLLEPNFNITLSNFGIIILPVTGVLLGLVYSAHIYWLQGGFSKLEYTQKLLEELIVADGKIVLDMLIGVSVISLFAVLDSVYLISVTFYLFSLFFISDLIKYTAELGYIQTLLSSKYIPSNYGQFRTYVRKIKNAGFSGWLRPLFLFFLIIFYPLFLSFDSISMGVLILNKSSIIVFILFSTLLSFTQVRSLITTAFNVRKDIEKWLKGSSKNNTCTFNNQVSSWNEDKRKIEGKVILERLESIGVTFDFKVEGLMSKSSWTSRDLTKPILNGYPIISENGNCHLNLIIPYLEDDLETRKFIFKWARKTFELLAESKTEVYDYKLSFFRRNKDISDTHFGVIRATRGSILKLTEKNRSDEDFIKNIEGKFLKSSIDEF